MSADSILNSRQGMLRGAIWLGIAQGIVSLCAFGVHIVIGRLWGPEKFGLYIVVMTILVWVEVFASVGIPTAVSKFIAEDETKSSVILKKAIKMQLFFAGLVFLVFFFAASPIGVILNDKRLPFYLRLAGIDIPIMGFCVLSRSVLAGQRRFGEQSIAVSSYGLSRIGFILLFVFLGFSLSGALVGNIIASIVGLVVAKHYIHFTKRITENFDGYKIVKFAVPIIFYRLSTDLLLCIDLLCVKALIKDEAIVGFYGSALTIAKVPYLIFYALTLTLLPSLSNSISKKNKELTDEYIHQALRLLLIILLPGIIIVLMASKEIVSLIYSTAFLSASSILNILIFGIGFFCFFMTLNAMIMANNKPKIPFFIAASLLPINFILNLSLIPIWGAEGAAVATTIANLIGMVVAAIIVFKQFLTLCDLSSTLKIIGASLIIYLMTLTGLTPWVWLNCVLLLLVYFGLLFALKEIKKEDLLMIRRVFSKGYPYENSSDNF